MKNSNKIFILLFVSFILINLNSQNEYPQKDFTISITQEIPLLHPHVSFSADEAQLLTAFYEGLFVYNPYTLQPVPAIAEKWTVTGGRTWRFTLRKTAQFENGEPITAQTFADSWLNLITPNSSGGNYQYASLLDCIDGVADYRTGKLKDKNQVGIKVESPHVLVVYTVSACTHLTNILCHHAFAAVNKSQLKDAEAFAKINKIKTAKNAFKPISSGAYKILKFTDEELIAVKNENYWDKNSVQIPRINIILRLKEEEAAAKFNNGEIDWLSRADVLSKIGDSRYIHIDPLFATEYFFFKTTAENTTDKKFREALLLALPYEQLRKNFFIKAETLIFPLAGYPKIEGVNEYNIFKAEKIISDLNLKPEQKKLIIKIPETEYYINLTNILITAWEKIGVSCDVTILPFSVYYEALKLSDYNLGVISWIGDFADPLAFLEMFRINSSFNDYGWKNLQFEQLIKKASEISEIKQRYEILSSAEKILLEENVIIPLSHNTSVNIIDLFALDGWHPNAIDIHPFKFIKFVKPQPLPGVVKILIDLPFILCYDKTSPCRSTVNIPGGYYVISLA